MKMKYTIELPYDNLDHISVMTSHSDDGMTFECKEFKVESITEQVPRERWKGDCGEKYYYLDDMYDVCADYDSDYTPHYKRYEYGNYYRTKEDADFARERKRLLNELESFACTEIKDQKHDYYYFTYCRGSHEIIIGCSSRFTDYLMFESKKDAEAAIKAVGADRIKKYYFRVE